MFHYGAQYYRYPNPLPEFWEEDFKRMEGCGFNTVKIWAMWNKINYKKGEYDFSDLLKLCELAQKHNMQVVINTIFENGPYWLVREHPEALHQSSLGFRVYPQSRGNTPGGGAPSLCFHNEPVKRACGETIHKMTEAFKDVSNLYAYDIWNEAKYEPVANISKQAYTGLFCFCDASRNEFVTWLKDKYKTLEGLNDAWFRMYSDWNEVYPPRQRGGYPDMLDFLQFRLDSMVGQMAWRYNAFRQGDKKVKLVSHFAPMELIHRMADNNRFADVVDEWGVSNFSGYSGNGDTTPYFLYKLDVARSEARGKKFWQAELKGGQNTGGNAHIALRRSDIPIAANFIGWNWSVLMSGAKGLLYWQYRPEQLGPETPGNGLVDLAGQPTERLETAAYFAKIISKIPVMQDSVPVPSDIGILRFYESAFMGYMLDETRDIYEKAVEGVYTAALRKNIVADVIYADGIDKYKFLYIPFAQMINTENIEKIRKFVENGGTVVAEACTAHYMDKGYCAFHIPGGLCDVFGGEELYTDYVEGKAFDSITFDNNLKIKPVIYAETLKADKGREIARYGNGKCAAVMNSFGKGKAILIGTYPSLIENEEVVSEVFAYIFGKMEIKQNIKSSRSGVNARLHTHGGMNYLYVVNQKNEKTEAVITIDLKFGCFLNAVSVVSGKIYKVKDNNLEISFEGSGGDCIELGR